MGALGIIMAFNFGGKPIYVMPLVFGGAPVINTLTSIVRSVIQTGSPGHFPWLFYPSLLLVIIGAVLVLVFSPKSRHPPGSGTPEPRPEKREKRRTRAQPPAPPEAPSVKPTMPPVADDPAIEPEEKGSVDKTAGELPTTEARADGQE